MKFEELVESIMNMNDDNKKELNAFFCTVRGSLEFVGSELEPLLKKVMIEKSVEYTTEKFKLLCSNGFTRDEAIRIIIGDNNRYEAAMRNAARRNPKSS